MTAEQSWHHEISRQKSKITGWLRRSTAAERREDCFVAAPWTWYLKRMPPGITVARG
jgi:hypothetical protein